MAEILRSQVQTFKMGFCKVLKELRYSTKCVALNLKISEHRVRIEEESQLRWFGHVSRCLKQASQTSFTCESKMEKAKVSTVNTPE